MGKVQFGNPGSITERRDQESTLTNYRTDYLQSKMEPVIGDVSATQFMTEQYGDSADMFNTNQSDAFNETLIQAKNFVVAKHLREEA